MQAKEHQANALRQEANDLSIKIKAVQDNQNALQSNKQFKETQEGYEQQIQILESDKVSLMKRLNMVLSELERATQEKSEINAKLLEQDRMADELKRKLDEVAQLKNVVNRNLQEDLRYEKELNEKLRAELERFEHEKSLLLKRLQDQEQLASDISKETSQIQHNLRRRSEELQKLQDEHEENLARLRDFNSQLDLLRSQEMQDKAEKRRMEDELDHLTRDRNDLIQRMNELRDRYDDYVNNMNREREEIMKQNRSHVKLLTAKLFFQILSAGLQFRKKVTFSSIQETANHMDQHTKRLVRFHRIFARYTDESKRHYLRLWYRKALNFSHENFKLTEIIDRNNKKKTTTQFFLRWRQAFLRNRAAFEHKLQSCKLIDSLANRKQDGQLRKYICLWRDFCDMRNLQGEAMRAVAHRHTHRSMRHAFVRWLADTKKGQMDDKYGKMSSLVTDLWFKQKVFLGLKQACMEQKIESQSEIFTKWKQNCEKKRQEKYLERKTAMVDRVCDTRDERLLQKCFDAIRFNNINQKYTETKQRLDQEIPVREELEHRRDELAKISKTKEKFRLFRKLFIRYVDVKYRAFVIWKDANDYHKHTMERVKLRLIFEHRKRLSWAFSKWKEGADKKVMVQMVHETEELINENQNLTNSLEATVQEKQKLADCTSRSQVQKLDRLKNMLDRNTTRARFHQWANVACFMSDLESGLALTLKTMRRRKMKNGFIRFKAGLKEDKRQEYVRHKCQWLANVRDRDILQTAVALWKEDHQKSLKAKAFLKRSIKGVDKLMQNEFFCLWKKMMFQARKKVYTDNIEELQKRQKEHHEQIEELNKQIEVNDSEGMHLQSKMTHQSHQIMANFITRFIHSSVARGFYTWLDEVKEHKQKRRFLRSTVLFWMKKKEAQGFRQWAEWTLKDKEQELANKLKAKEEERRVTQEKKDQENNAQETEIAQLHEEHQEASLVRDQLENNFNKALGIHLKRKEENQYIDKRLNMLLMWREVNRKEKNAVNVIGAIARQTFHREIFQRIRQQARENYLENEAARKQNALFRLMKSSKVRVAFGKWRALNFTRTREEMELKQKQLVETRQRQEAEFEMMQERKMEKAERIIKQRRQREIATEWIKMARYLKALKVKDEILKQNLQYAQEKRAIKKWYERVQCTLYLRRRNEQVIKSYQLLGQRKVFQEWVKQTRITKALCSRTYKFIQRLQYLEKASAFSQLQHYQHSYEERTRERKEYGSQMISKTLVRLYKHKLSDTLLNLKNRAHKRDFKEKFLQRCFRHAIHARTRHFFQKWKHNSDRQVLADIVNTEGDVVLERNQVRNNVKVLKQFLVDQGYDSQKIDEYLLNKGENQRANMTKAVTSLFFKASDFQIVPKAMNQWKRWIEQRRLYKDRCQFVRNALNNPLFWAFRKWKDHDKHAAKRLKHLTKQDLIEKIITDEMAIGSAKSRLGRMDEAIEHLQIQRDNLVQHFIGGQKLALALARNNHEKTMMRAFLRWKKSTQEDEQERLGIQLDRTNQMIQDLAAHVNKLESINRNLTQENEELRQAALDGIEIAKAVQELTKEREGLSDDLQGRSNTIKKLIADNHELNLRLSIAQKEAEQLEQLNNQSFVPPPERDF